MRSFWLHFALGSAPLLASLAILLLVFESEAAATVWFGEYCRQHPLFDTSMVTVSAVGNPLFYAVYLAILLRGLMTRRTGLTRLALVYLAVQLLVSLLLVRLLKISLGRPRPGAGLLFEPMTLSSSHHALPSGHTCEITAASLPLALWRRNIAISLAVGVVAGAVGLSRIVLGWHHVSDVFFGWLLGAVGALAIYLFGARPANR